jgi:hypothetical protein
MENLTLTERKVRHNKRLAQLRVKWLIEHSTSHQLLCRTDSLCSEIGPLRQTL